MGIEIYSILFNYVCDTQKLSELRILSNSTESQRWYNSKQATNSSPKEITVLKSNVN